MPASVGKKRHPSVLRPSAARHPVLSLHPYWSKKPWNVVAYSIQTFSRPGQIVLDPFCGSGTTIFESLRMGRKAVGLDINPLAIFIARTLTQNLRMNQIQILSQHLERATRTAKERIFENGLFATVCPRCGSSATVLSTVYDSVNYADDPRERIYKERYSLIQCDVEKSHKQKSNLNRTLRAESRSVSLPPLLTKPLFENRRINIYQGLTVADVFTPRNLAALQILLHEVKKIVDSSSSFAKLAFSSILDDASKRRCEGGGLTLNSLWIPKKGMVERNPIDLFEKRIRRVITACRLLSIGLKNRTHGNSVEEVLCGDASVFLKQISATEICNEIPPRSVDYVHADPPFVDQVPYLELSSFWCNWLGIEIDARAWADEIVLSDSSERPLKKRNTAIGQYEYENKMKTVMSNISFCLKRNAYATFWFSAQKEIHWRVITDSLKVNGFCEKTYWKVSRRIQTFKANRERVKTRGGRMLNYDIVIHATLDGRNRVPSAVDEYEARRILEKAKRKLRWQQPVNAGALYAEYILESLEKFHEPPPEALIEHT